MAGKKRPLLSPKIRVLLDRALVEALKRYIDRKPKTQRPKKKAGKKKTARRPAKKSSRKRR